jgi:hypothetical protein
VRRYELRHCKSFLKSIGKKGPEQYLEDACAILPNLCDGKRLRPFRGFVFGFRLERFPDGFETNKPLFVWLFLTRRQKARVAVRNFSDRLLLAHMSPFALKAGLPFKRVA